MQDLVNALNRASEAPIPSSENSEAPYGFLREASVRWAKFCLYYLTGSALTHGMGISAAIAQFINELEDKKTD